MLGTGGSAKLAIKILKEKGVKEENIVFVNLISCEEGITSLLNEYPGIKIVTA
jgi:uracil phosphoribosyltransferase